MKSAGKPVCQPSVEGLDRIEQQRNRCSVLSADRPIRQAHCFSIAGPLALVVVVVTKPQLPLSPSSSAVIDRLNSSDHQPPEGACDRLSRRSTGVATWGKHGEGRCYQGEPVRLPWTVVITWRAGWSAGAHHELKDTEERAPRVPETDSKHVRALAKGKWTALLGGFWSDRLLNLNDDRSRIINSSPTWRHSLVL